MWNRTIDRRTLTFRLAGINNQNFLMRDEETGSYWQQISGKAISGPLKGRQLDLMHSDELTFSLWRAENPSGTVLAPVAKFASKYEPKDWESRIQKARTVVDTKQTPYGPRELMLGVEQDGSARAYVLAQVLQQKLIQDRVGATPVIVVVGPDELSVRVFEARIEGQDGVPEFYRETIAGSGEAAGADRAILIDSVTGSGWNFQGCSVRGPATGRCLRALPAIKDYWFDLADISSANDGVPQVSRAACVFSCYRCAGSASSKKVHSVGNPFRSTLNRLPGRTAPARRPIPSSSAREDGARCCDLSSRYLWPHHDVE